MTNKKDWSKVPIPQNYTDLYKNYGNPSDPNFAKSYLTQTEHFLSNKKSINITHHVAITEHLHNIFASCSSLIDDCGGSYNYRPVRGSTTHLSLHSWGLAIDINVKTNPLGSLTPEQPAKLLSAFKKEGFFWGGNYHHRKDPMHFQYAGDF